jgi:predicted alpha/beta-hydrolase family hydrolase
VRSAVVAASGLADGAPLFAAGRSMGARMTLRAQAVEPLPGVLGLVFFAFPLHRPLRLRDEDPPRLERAAHLNQVHLPMLFLQGTRDALARAHLLQTALSTVQPRFKTLHWVEGADHSFQVLKSLGRTLEDIEEELASRVASWIAATVHLDPR